jgi:hypothetical protein
VAKTNHPNAQEREVQKCYDCPAFWQNMEYPETKCRLHPDGLWHMGYQQRGEPTPEECPLRKGPIILRLISVR